MSPEQAQTTGYVRPASDQYSLGLVLFEMLTGVAYRRLNAEDLQTRLAALPPPVRALIQRMSAVNPNDRYPSMGAVLAAIQAVEHELTTQDVTDLPAVDERGPRVAAGGPPGIAVGSPHAPTYANTGTSGTPPREPATRATHRHSPHRPGRRDVITHESRSAFRCWRVALVALIALGAFFALSHRGSSTPAPQTATAGTNLNSATPQQATAGATITAGGDRQSMRGRRGAVRRPPRFRTSPAPLRRG